MFSFYTASVDSHKNLKQFTTSCVRIIEVLLTSDDNPIQNECRHKILMNTAVIFRRNFGMKMKLMELLI